MRTKSDFALQRYKEIAQYEQFCATIPSIFTFFTFSHPLYGLHKDKIIIKIFVG